MRRPRLFLISVTILQAILFSGCTNRIVFEDQGLRQAVARAVGVGTSSLTLGDAGKITALDAARCGIASLQGIEALKSLETLILDDNALTDLQPLVDAKLTSLAAVSAVGNPLPVGLNSRVYQQVAALADRGITVMWLPSFALPVGRIGVLKEMAQSSDGALVAIGDGSIVRVDLRDSAVKNFGCPWYPSLQSIVCPDGLALSNNSPTAETGPWEYAFRFPDGFTSRRLLSYPAGNYRMVQLPDTTRLLVGSPYDRNGSREYALVARLKTDGDEQWSVSIEGMGGGRSAVGLTDGFAVLGSRGLAQLSADGRVVRTVNLAAEYGERTVWLDRVIKVDDGCAVLGVPEDKSTLAVVLAYTSDLVLLSKVSLSLPAEAPSHARVFGFARTGDGGFILTVHNWSFPEERAGGMLLKTDAQGALVWCRSYADYALDAVMQTADGGFAVTARGADRTTYIIKTDASGRISDMAQDPREH